MSLFILNVDSESLHKKKLSIPNNRGLLYNIMIYPNTFQDKDTILPYLDDYNHRKNKKDQVIYQDMADTMMGFTGGLMSAITYVLIAFAGILW